MGGFRVIHTWLEFVEWFEHHSVWLDDKWADDLAEIHEMVNTPAEYRDPWDDDGLPEQ